MGIVADFTRHNTPITLRVRELKSSFSGDDFAVKDAITRKPVFDVRAKAFSISQRKTLHDHTGRPLFEFCRDGISFMQSYIGYQCGNQRQRLFHVEKIGMFNAKLQITFSNLVANGQQEKWVLRGQWLSGSSQITTEAGVVVASIERDYANAGQLLFRKQTYEVTIAPGVDAALITAICVCLDEAYNER